jgi:CubicO group peptidase (beta-lactamase class C family)
MKDTGFFVPAEKRERFTTAYFSDPETGGLVLYDAPDGQWSRPPAFPNGADGLVSTADDYLAFAQMLVGGGARGATRLLRADSVAQMTRDQLTPAQKARTEMFGLFETHGWGYGMAVVTGRDDSGPPGTFGWDGGMGSSFRADPAARAVTLLLTSRGWPSAQPPPVFHEFWQAAGAALGR